MHQVHTSYYISHYVAIEENEKWESFVNQSNCNHSMMTSFLMYFIECNIFFFLQASLVCGAQTP
jgi:hypothetical protein